MISVPLSAWLTLWNDKQTGVAAAAGDDNDDHMDDEESGLGWKR